MENYSLLDIGTGIHILVLFGLFLAAQFWAPANTSRATRFAMAVVVLTLLGSAANLIGLTNVNFLIQILSAAAIILAVKIWIDNNRQKGIDCQ